MRMQVKREWILLVIALVLMICTPLFLLTREPENIPELEPILITRVSLQEIAPVDALIEKPIFNPRRAKVVLNEELMAGDEADADQQIETPQQSSNPVPTLVGLVSKKRGKAVAIVRNMAGKTENLKRGQSVDGWRLVSLGANKAVFANAGNRETISLDYRNTAIGGPSSVKSNNDSVDEEQPMENGDMN